MLVVNPDATAEQIADAMGQLRREDFDATAELLPSVPSEAPCRICGEVRLLTLEHLPPRGALNKGRGREVDAVAQLGSDELDVPEIGAVKQGGLAGYTLCEDCNNFTGRRWGRAYQEWALSAYRLLSSQPKKPDQIDLESGFGSFQKVAFRRVYPGRFARQALSIMASISAGPGLCERHPEIRELILGGPEQPLPGDLRLHFLLYGSPVSRIVGGPRGQLYHSFDPPTTRRVLSFDFPPVALVLQLEGPPMDLGVDISTFAQIPVDVRQDVTIEDLPLGFGHKPWPCDYRSAGQLRLERAWKSV